MFPCNGVSRIKLKRDSFKQNNKLEPNKRRWTGPKIVSGLNPFADRGSQVQGQDSSPAPEAADVDQEICASANPAPPSNFDGHSSSKQDVHAEHGDRRGRYNQGTFPSTVSGLSNCGGGVTKARVICTRSQTASEKALKRLSEHKKDLFYRLRLALCFARKKRLSGGKRIHGPTETPCRSLSYINSEVSVESDNISINVKSTVCGESVGKSPPAQLDPKYNQKLGRPDYLKQEKSRRGRKPRKLFIDHFGGSDGDVKTTIKTEVRRTRASKARPAISGRTANISSKVELRRQLRSDTRKHCKRLVKNSCCALCGDVKYTPRPSTNLVRLLNHRLRAGRPSPTAWRKGSCHISESPPLRITQIFRFEKYPLVKLCDVARVFDIATRDFSCVLPAVLRQKRKCKRVRCLKKEFGFLMHPHLHGIRKQRSKIAKQSWEVSTPTRSCASFSSGDPLSGATRSTCISDTAETPDGSVKEWDACLARNPDCKKMRQTDVEGTASVLPCCDDNSPVVCFCEKDKTRPMKNISESPTSPVRRVSPLILRRVTANSFGIADENENSALSLNEVEDSRNEGSDSEVNSPESFSCQRTQAYIFFTPSSCARTCKIWPFPRMGPPKELRPLHRTGPRWIVTTAFPATVQTSLGEEPECLSDKDDENKLSECTMQSKSTDEAREVMEGQLLSPVPGEKPPADTLAVLDRISKDGADSLNNPGHALTQDIIHISKLADHNTCSALDKKPSTCTLEKTWKGLVDSPRVILTRVSKPAELESNQSLKNAFEVALESSASVATEQVNNYKLNGHGYAASLGGSGLLKHHSLLKKSNQEVLSSGQVVPNQSDVPDNREEDRKLPKDSSVPEPVSQTSRAPSFEYQEGNANGGRKILSNPESLSKICLKVKMLKARCTSLVTASSSVDQDTKSVTPNSVALTPDSNPDCSGEWKRTQVFDTNTDSSEDEHKNVTSLSSDEESVEHQAAEILWSDDNGTCQIKNKEGSTPPSSQVVADSFLDVSRAYEEDVLVLDVIQDDPELFGAVVTETVRKRDASTEENEETQLKTEPKLQTGNYCKIVWDQKTDRLSKYHSTAAEAKMENMKDGGSVTVKETPSSRAQPAQGMNTVKSENATDCNNNQEMRDTNNLNALTVINTTATRLVMDTCSNEREMTAKETSALRTLNGSYCWYYFSEYSTCLRNTCWFLHLPRDGDEKFCMDTVKKFCHVGKHALILRAVEVFMGYYNKCSPSTSFSQEVVNSLLSSLLNMCLLREFEAVINLLLTHKRLPPPEVMLAVFKLVRERGLINTVPELILLTSKIVEAGCIFNVHQCEVMQSHLQMMQVPRQQVDIFLAVKCRALVTNPHTSELSDLAQAVVRVEMLKHQDDWAGLAALFCGVCVGSHSPTELLRFCCCVTMALLKELKDKLAIPYELFAESVCQQAWSNEMTKTLLGRIGVSLIFRYHRTQEWNKGVKLVSVMFRLHIEFITLKGIMGNEHRVSRCQLVTMATELFLHSGSIEGALKMLRADGWFVSSNMWPCEQADIESRKHVLTLLAGKTSHRDTFEILTNLPGFRQPINGVLINDYTEMFSAHLRLCVIKQTLPVAADIVEFMLIHGMVPETLQLQNLVHKLGKQNNWSRARALFKRAQTAGFYSAVVCESNGLFLPCSLSEIEMTLAFEMFITFINTNLLALAGSSQPLLITLKRHAGVEDVTESVYLAAGCRLLSAALIPNPKLSIRYTAVNQSQEQLFQLDRASAHKWFLQNERWAQEFWAS